MNSPLFLKSAPLLLAASLAFGSAAHAQEFSFTSPAGSALTVHPGDSILFSGTLHNDQLEQLDSVTIGLNSSYGGKFTFASPFFADLAAGQTRNFTGTLKISKTAMFSPAFFYLDANGTGDLTGDPYDLTSSNFKVTLAANPVPETSTTLSLGLLLAGLGLLVARSRKQTATKA